MTFAEKGSLLVQILEGAARSDFMAELGEVLLHKLHRDDVSFPRSGPGPAGA